MKLSAKSGTAIAAAAAALIMSGATLSTINAAENKVKCFGANSCKGQSACKTASSSCKGLNSCKGQGFLLMTTEECSKVGGSLEDPGKKS